MSDVTELSKSVDKLNKTINTLAGATLFSNAKMNEMISASDKIKDNFEEIKENESDIIKDLKTKEKLLKEENTLLKKQADIEKKRFELKQRESDIDEKNVQISKNRIKIQSNLLEIQKKEKEISEKELELSNKKLEMDKKASQLEQVRNEKQTRQTKKKEKTLLSEYNLQKKSFDSLKESLDLDKERLDSLVDGSKELSNQNDLLNNEIILSKQLNKEIESAIELDKNELELLKQQSLEEKKQNEQLSKQSKLRKSLGSDLSKQLSNLKTFATGTIGKFLSAGVLIDGMKELYKQSNKVYDSYYSLSLPLQKAEKGMMALAKKTNEYIWSVQGIKNYAAAYGYDMEKVEPMVNALQAKVKYIKQNAQGKYEWDVEKLSENAKHLISISKLMNMESDDMVGLLEDRIRRFGDTDKEAISSMHEMTAATLTFNEVMGQGSVFTEEVGKHLLELHQNTKYWTQDFGMLNTMFNTHVSLLLKQGKHQKEALSIARQFQDSLQNPPELIKWKSGSKILADFKKQIKGLSDEEAALKISKEYGVDDGTAQTAVKAIREGKNTGFTQANILQELLGGTKRGMQSTIEAWSSFKNFDSTVLRDMGLAQSTADAEKIKQLIKDVEKMGLSTSTTTEEAINKLVDMEKGLSDEQKEARKKELKSLMQANSSKDGQQVQSPFENSILETTKIAENWFANPFVKIAAGSVGALGGIFSDTLSYVLGGVLLKKGGAILGGIGKIGKGVTTQASVLKELLGKTASSTKGALNKSITVKSISEKVARARKGFATGADRTYKKFLDAQIKSGKFEGEVLESLKSERKAMSARAKLTGAGKGIAKSVRKIPAVKGSLAAMAVGAAASFIGSDRNRWDEEAIKQREIEKKAVVDEGLTSLDLIKRGYANSIEEAIALQNKFAKNGSASWKQLVKSGAGALEGIATVFTGPMSAGIGAVTGAVEAFQNDVNPLKGAIGGVAETFVGAAESVMGFLADFNTEFFNDHKRAAKALAEYRKELGYLTGSLKVSKASITDEAKARLEKTATSIYTNKALATTDSYMMSTDMINAINKEFDFGTSLTSTRALAKGSGLSKEEYLASKGLSGSNVSEESKDKYRFIYDAAKEVAKARVMSTVSDWSDEDIEAETQAIMDEQLKAQQELAIQQQQQFEEEKRLQEQLIKKEESMLENSNDQNDYLKILAGKAAMDVAVDSGKYKKYAGKENSDAVFRTDGSGNVAVNLHGFSQSVASSFKGMFGS